VKDNDKPKKKLVPTRAKPKESLTKVRKSEPKAESSDVASKARKVMPSKPLVQKSSTPPPSKLKKDENNKKVMETRKAAAARTQKKQPDNEEKNRLSKVSRPATLRASARFSRGSPRSQSTHRSGTSSPTSSTREPDRRRSMLRRRRTNCWST